MVGEHLQHDRALAITSSISDATGSTDKVVDDEVGDGGGSGQQLDGPKGSGELLDKCIMLLVARRCYRVAHEDQWSAATTGARR